MASEHGAEESILTDGVEKHGVSNGPSARANGSYNSIYHVVV